MTTIMLMLLRSDQSYTCNWKFIIIKYTVELKVWAKIFRFGITPKNARSQIHTTVVCISWVFFLSFYLIPKISNAEQLHKVNNFSNFTSEAYKITQKRLFVRYCWNLESISPMLSLCYYVILIYRKYHCWTLQPVKCLLSKGQVSQLDNLFLCEMITNRHLPE